MVFRLVIATAAAAARAAVADPRILIGHFERLKIQDSRHAIDVFGSAVGGRVHGPLWHFQFS
jgi:hypothetical protein